jgi:hypothetical protein
MTDGSHTDRSGTGVSDDPNELGDLDPSQFVGDAPVGDASPGEFISNDISGHSPERGADPDGPDQSDDPDTQEDT